MCANNVPLLSAIFERKIIYFIDKNKNDIRNQENELSTVGMRPWIRIRQVGICGIFYQFYIFKFGQTFFFMQKIKLDIRICC